LTSLKTQRYDFWEEKGTAYPKVPAVRQERDGRGWISMKIIIVGCGRVGASLARRFVDQGHHVAVVDKDRSAFSRLGESFGGKTVVGLGFDEDILKKAGIQKAEVFVALTGGDNSNIMAAQIAQTKYNIPKVLARVKDPLRAEVYKEIGLNTYCSTLLGSAILEDAVLDRPFRSIEEYLGQSFPQAADPAALESPESEEESPASPEP
jgi:trk system potassium uptake protein TrkA